MRRSATIYDIARETGLSHTTVSQALRDSACVKEETRKRVHQVASRLGYRRNLSAAQLRVGHSHKIALIVPWQFDLQVALHHELQHLLQKHGYDLVVYPVLSPDERQDVFEQILASGYDGVVTMLYSFSQLRPHIHLFAARHCPVAIVGTPYDAELAPGIIGFDSTDMSGLHCALQKLFALGHTKILHAIGEDQTTSPHNRLVCDEVGKIAPPGWPTEIFLKAGTTPDSAAGYELAARILKERPEATAIQCPNDLFACGLIRGFNDLGVRVPEDFSVVGSENLGLCEYMTPRLASISVGEVHAGRQIVESLLEHIREDEWSDLAYQFELKAEFHCRESVAPPRKGLLTSPLTK